MFYILILVIHFMTHQINSIISFSTIIIGNYCGVFTCMATDRLSTDREFDYDQNNMDHFWGKNGSIDYETKQII